MSLAARVGGEPHRHRPIQMTWRRRHESGAEMVRCDTSGVSLVPAGVVGDRGACLASAGLAVPRQPVGGQAGWQAASTRTRAAALAAMGVAGSAVSYTHLTLPTKRI